MIRVTKKPVSKSRSGPGRSVRTAPSSKAPRTNVPSADRLLDEVESVARIGSYTLDIPAGRWVSSNGLDAIFGIDAAFDRSLEGWASLVHADDREGMVTYFAEEVLGRGQRFDRRYRIVRADTGEERWVQGLGALEFDESGRPVRMFGTIADITVLQKTQEEVIASEHPAG